MDGDEYIFALFQEMMERMEEDYTEGRLRMLSKNPRFAADDPEQKPKKTQIEKR